MASASGRFVRDRGYLTLLLCLGAALVAAALFGVAYGSATVPLRSVTNIVTAHLWGDPSAVDPIDERIVVDFRIPRVLLAALAGAGLSVAGVTLQALVRNPLADPYVLGATSGASLGAVLVIAYGPAVAGGLGVSGAAFVGAMVSLLAVFVLAQRSGEIQPTRLILSGVAIAYLVTAFVSYVQLTSESQVVGAILFWILGSVAGAEWGELPLPAVVIGVASTWLLLRRRSLDALAMGDDAAYGLGVDVRRFRIELLVVSSVLVATVVAVAGGVAFIGLMIPHVARLLVGPDHRRVLPVSLVLGALFLVLVDIMARMVDRPNELPLGIFTAAMGAPFFLWLLRSRRTAA